MNSKLSGISGILFDLDNTLIGIRGMGKYLRTLTREILSREFGIFDVSDEDIYTLFKSGKGHREVLRGWDIEDPDEFWRFVNHYDFEHRNKMAEEGMLYLYDDVKPVLENLSSHNIPLGVVSNTTTQVVRWSLEKFGIAHFFTLVRGLGDNQDLCKPEPDGLHHALSEWGVDKRKTDLSSFLFIGDSPIDVESAFRAGLTPVWIFRKETYGNHSEQFVHSLHEKMQALVKKYRKKSSLSEGLLVIHSLFELISLI